MTSGEPLENRLRAVGGDGPLLVCVPADLRPPPPPAGVTLQRVDAYAGTEALRALADVEWLARVGREPTAAERAAVPAELETGLGVLARVGIGVAGGGHFAIPAPGVARLAGLGVLEAFRARGVATALVAELTRLAFRAGAEHVVATGPAGCCARVGFTALDR